MPTIKDVAKKAGVSVATASYAINGDERIKAETRQKVIDAAIELHYIPNGSAKNLKRQKSNIILVFVSSFGGPIYQEILSYLDEKLTKLDYRMIICNGSLATYIIEEKNFDAIINLDATIDSRMLELISRFYPVIDTTRDYECKRMISLPIPGAEPVYEATLMAINDGNKKIGFMHGSIDSYDDKERFRGFKLALDEFGLEPYCILQGRFTTTSGYDAVKEYLCKNNELPEVLICSNDEMAIGTLDYLKKINYDMSKFKIIGFDNIQIGNYYKLTSISVDRDGWTTLIVDTLDKLINNQEIIKRECNYEIIRRNTF